VSEALTVAALYEPVAALYERRFFTESTEIPAVIDRRYRVFKRPVVPMTAATAFCFQ